MQGVMEAFEAKFSNSVKNDLKASNRKAEGECKKHTDRANRATSEQVLDPRTRMILFKMINKKIICEMNGCISTGKEANVYHATTDEGIHCAIKIYKTSILIFKDRDRYVSGEFRFRHGYSRHNPRKMVKLWAEKEMRNLKRLQVAQIPSPEPLHLKSHVLILSFIGDSEGIAAPRLKDASFTAEEAVDMYFQCCLILRKMYQECKLIHADFSEYNLLLLNGTIYVIDVSQSVEHDHPHSLEFLRLDIANTNDFFRKHGVVTMTLRELFDFTTDIHISDADAEINRIKLMLEGRDFTYFSNEELKLDEDVFKQSYIPRTLDEVIDIERDIDRVAMGDTEDILYQKITGLAIDVGNQEEAEESNSDISDSSDCSDSNGSSSLEDFSDSCPEDEERKKQLRKEWKKFVKEEKRERRKTKLKKHVKKRKAKVSKPNIKK